MNLYSQNYSLNDIDGVPDSVKSWINYQLDAKSPGQIENSFFKRDSVLIIGYIKDYDVNSNITSGIIYHRNDLVNEDYPTTIQIYPDGRFEVKYLAFHKHMNGLWFNDNFFNYYIEPGESLAMILNMEEIRNRTKKQNITYFGRSKRVNEEINNIELKIPSSDEIVEYKRTLKPIEFVDKMQKIWDADYVTLEKDLNKLKFLPLSSRLLKDKFKIDFANRIFDYTMSREYYSKQDTTNEILKIPIDESYYQFINRIDLNDTTLLSSQNFDVFINRFEFSPLYNLIKYQHEHDPLIEMYRNFMRISNHYKEVPFIFKIASLRRIKSFFKNIESDSLLQVKTDQFYIPIANPLFSREIEYLKEKRELNKIGYELPNSLAADSFRKIINNHKGKYLVVDFWAQWCGPCRVGIESTLELREKLANHPDLDFVFITDVSGTPDMLFYENYTKDNFMKNSYRVSTDDYLALRELFNFNGIPHYVLIDNRGRIRDDNFANSGLISELKTRFPEKFKDIENYVNKKGGH